MIRLFREMVREVAMLPLPAKILLGLGISSIFVVITQWERLGFDVQWERLTRKQPPAVIVSKAPVPPQQSEKRSFDFPAAPPADTMSAAAVEALLLKRIGRLNIVNPQVQPNGSIIGNGQTVYLFGIKQFDRNTLCKRASGERWACGLRAYATLRNSIEHKTIECEPKKRLPNGISALCRMESTNVGSILGRGGLAEIEDDTADVDLRNAQAFAKSRKLGIWDR
jgi:endonuclease YncB( thermonuclease family)